MSIPTGAGAGTTAAVVPAPVAEVADRLRQAGHVITFRPARHGFPGTWTAYCACGSGIYVSPEGEVLAGALSARQCGRLRSAGAG